jgi:hypothetical protein
MTEQQMNTISGFRQKYEANVEAWIDWDSKNTCVFDLYESTKPDDPYIVLVMTTIDTVHDSLAGVLTITKKMIISPDGKAIPLTSQNEQDKIDNYIASLKKIN